MEHSVLIGFTESVKNGEDFFFKKRNHGNKHLFMQDRGTSRYFGFSAEK